MDSDICLVSERTKHSPRPSFPHGPFLSKATAAFSKIARMVVAKRLSTARLLQFHPCNQICSEARKAETDQFIDERSL
jgi:hypothetical protein